MGAIQLVTEIPGPKSREIMARHDRYVARAMSVGFPAVVERAKGALFSDVDGNTFIDLAGGVGVMNVGHSDPEVLAAAREQMERFVHTDYTIAPYAAYSELARRLCEKIPGAERAAFFNSGAEAVENAIKIARAYTGRQAVLTFESGFHGRSWMALSLTSKTRPYKQGFAPLASEVYRLPYANQYRPPVQSANGRSLGESCAELLEKVFSEHVAAEEVAALIIEPVQGEGGFVVPPNDYLPALKRKCEEHGIVFIADEVQTGFGRTGKLFAVEHSGVVPDLVTVAKSIAAGFPLSGVLGRAEVMDAPVEGSMGGTYPGNPVALASALAVLEKFEDGSLLERANRIGETVRERFGKLAREVDLIGHVRGLGAMSAIELVRDRETKEPAGEEVSRIIRLAADRGVLALPAGVKGNCIRILSPLVITEEELEEALTVLESCIREVAEKSAAHGKPREDPERDPMSNPV